MLYRDLLPDRVGGAFIVSHIRIPHGGPVPDYVHHHRVRFQLIYCRRGWVRVVYEDQGDPFVLQAGDCVLQPPGIRHRVLESSEGMEVIEISSPAEHPTFVEHDLSLPNALGDPDRTWDGQRFVRHQASAATWMPSVWFQICDLGVKAATDGLVEANVLRRTGQTAAEPWQHDRSFWIRIVLYGSITYEAPDHPAAALHAGQAVDIPAGAGVMFTDPTDDLQMLEVVANDTISTLESSPRPRRAEVPPG
jgi:quercetin dioxygenase-like cupin family protein